jgi:hypothetical protein
MPSAAASCEADACQHQGSLTGRSLLPRYQSDAPGVVKAVRLTRWCLSQASSLGLVEDIADLHGAVSASERAEEVVSW